LISKAIDRAKLRNFCCGVNKEWRVRESVQKTGRVTFGDCGRVVYHCVRNKLQGSCTIYPPREKIGATLLRQ